MSFPLFDSLYTDTMDTHETEFTDENRQFILQHITDLDDYGREIFFAIIRKDQIKSMYTQTLPSSCKQLKSGMRIDFDKIPNHVKFMLFEFMRRHLQKMNEDAIFLKS
jgi:hypothetical protein